MPSDLTINILLLLTQSRLSIAQASSSFECFDTCTFMYATPTFITEAFHLVTQVQLLLMNVTTINALYSASFLLLG